MKHFEHLMFLKRIKGIGLSKINKDYIITIPSYPEFDAFVDFVRSKENLSDSDVAQAMDMVDKMRILIENDEKLGVITQFDNDYPERFRKLGNQRPLFFYIVGNREILHDESIAVVGTRKPSIYGESATKKLVKELPDMVIVSGLALGCDRLAHTTAIDIGAKTIGVLPSGIYNIAPASNKQLAFEIANGNGCLISEYDPYEPAANYTYLRRDSIIAAISDGVLVIECGEKSGTMHTVDAAIKMNKPIACYYTDRGGDYTGNKKLLDAKQAMPLSVPSDIRNLIDKTRENQESIISEQISIHDL